MAKGFLEAIFARKKIRDIKVLSAGTNSLDGAEPTREAVEVMKRYGIDISGHRAVQLGRDLIEKACLILVMDSRHRDRVLELDPGSRDRVFMLKEFAGEKGNPELSDPAGQTLAVYENCAAEINSCLKRALPKILKSLGECREI